ncbi:MAG: hypothetical protein ACTSUB_01105 [Candidatus Thorarchaeota archaeon]
MSNVATSKGLQSKNPMLLKLRSAALERAFSEIRNKRIKLDEKVSKGWISNSDYQQSIVNLILESKGIQDEKKEIDKVLNPL